MIEWFHESFSPSQPSLASLTGINEINKAFLKRTNPFEWEKKENIMFIHTYGKQWKSINYMINRKYVSWFSLIHTLEIDVRLMISEHEINTPNERTKNKFSNKRIRMNKEWKQKSEVNFSLVYFSFSLWRALCTYWLWLTMNNNKHIRAYLFIDSLLFLKNIFPYEESAHDVLMDKQDIERYIIQ
jgi:hypothetical protein